MPTSAGTISNVGQPRPVGWRGGGLDATRVSPGGGSTDGDWSWAGDVAVALLKGLLSAREGAASHTTSQSFPRLTTGAEGDGCRCSCFGDLGTVSVPVSRHPVPSRTGSPADCSGLPATGAKRPGEGGMESIDPLPPGPMHSTGTGPSFEAEVRGQTPREIDLELAALAQDVNDLDGRGVDGWTRLDEAQLEAANIDPEMLEDPRTGFRAAIYTDGKGRHVLAFAGTNPTEFSDWVSNFRQGLGFEDEQYVQARRLAEAAEVAFGDDLVITGHSLGGGLASVAALATDSAAVTFNAAGLHDSTMRELGLPPDDARAMAEDGLIRSYVVDGEVVTYLQEDYWRTAPIAPDAVGHTIELADPHSFWEHLNPLNLWEPSHRVRLHLMEAVLDAMQQDRPWE